MKTGHSTQHDCHLRLLLSFVDPPSTFYIKNTIKDHISGHKGGPGAFSTLPL